MMRKAIYPNITDLELTNDCNLNCPICTENSRIKWQMDLNFLEKILSKNSSIIGGSSIWLHFRWEPLLYKNLFEAINLLKKYWVKWSFSTNWILLNDSLIQKISESNINRIVVSAMTQKSEDYKKLRWLNSLKIVEENILKLKKSIEANESKVRLQVMWLNYWQWKSEIDKFIKYYNSLWIDVSIHNFSTRTWEVKEVYNKEKLGKKIERKPCHWLFRKMWILWDWKIAPCCYDMEWKVFDDINLKDYDFDIMKVWNDDIYKKIRKEHNSMIFKWNCEKCIDRKYEHPQLDWANNTFIKIYPSWNIQKQDLK